MRDKSTVNLALLVAVLSAANGCAASTDTDNTEPGNMSAPQNTHRQTYRHTVKLLINAPGVY